MDAVLTAVTQSLPELGIGGIVVWVLLLLLRRESSTEERHAAEIARINRAHDEELAELREDVRHLRAQVDQLNADLDAERSRRREIEDELASARRRGVT